MKFDPMANVGCILSIYIALTAKGLAASQGLVGHWNFDDETGRDVTGNSSVAVIDGAALYKLSSHNHCLRFDAHSHPVRIQTSPDSPIAIERGTIALWLNMAWDGDNILEYDNGAIQFRIYRRHFQPRFKGNNQFDYGSCLLDYDWPKYDMREWAFYPHVRAAVGDSEWHHFAVAYDDHNKLIKGWRDGEPISTVDLATLDVEPLRTQDLSQIIIGDEFTGFIDDIRIYNRVLSDEDVQTLFRGSHSTYEDRSDTIPTDRVMEVYNYQAEDAPLYQAWLQYAPTEKTVPPPYLEHLVVSLSDPTVRTAARELNNAVHSLFGTTCSRSTEIPEAPCIVLGTPDTSSWIKAHSEQLGLNQVKHDGFVIRTLASKEREKVIIAARQPGGVIQGTFELIRRLQTGSNVTQLNLLENPRIPIRMVGHWSNFRGFLGDNWRGGRRDNSIYSWEELRQNDTTRIRDWVRLLASAGWNALCPSEVNWSYRNNFLEHLDEVETLAKTCRDFGVTLYWSPSYLLALDPDTASAIYERVPDFGGYVLKLGSEKQNGDPRPAMVNRIADTLKPFGGHAIVRAFVYGNSRYTPEPYRNLIPHDLFATEDNHFRDNVILTPKSGPLDWDLSAPIPALDGVFQHTKAGSEWVIDKSWPVSWVEKWKWWMNQDTYRNGPGTFNKDSIHCVMGVSMISPTASWAASALNMVNYFGLGRLAWNPDLSLEEIYNSWIRQTFGPDPEVRRVLQSILRISDDALRKLYLYRGYRGVWIDRGDDGMVEGKTPHVIGADGIGIRSQSLQQRVLTQYAPGLQDIYGDPSRAEEFLTTFHFRSLNHRLSIGRTLIQDVYANLEEAVTLADLMLLLWRGLEQKIDSRRFHAMTQALEEFAAGARSDSARMADAFQTATKRDRSTVLSKVTQPALAEKHTFNVRHFGATGDGLTDDTLALRAALNACAQAQGGTLFFPSGLYRSSSLQLHSHMTLALDIGAVLMPHNVDQPSAPASPILLANNVEDIQILGPGSLQGASNGQAISLKSSSGVTIRNLNLRKFAVGIALDNSSKVTIDHTNVTSSQSALSIDHSEQISIRYSQLSSVPRISGKPLAGGPPITLNVYPPSSARSTPRIVVENSVLSSTRPMQYQADNVEIQNSKLIQVTIPSDLSPLAP